MDWRDQRPSVVLQGRIMSVDRAGLGFLGMIFGGLTAAVMLVACTVVLGHLEGRYQLDAPTARVAFGSSAIVR